MEKIDDHSRNTAVCDPLGLSLRLTNYLRSDLFGMIHVCYSPIMTKFRIAAE
jgi:hypothetical protein